MLKTDLITGRLSSAFCQELFTPFVGANEKSLFIIIPIPILLMVPVSLPLCFPLSLSGAGLPLILWIGLAISSHGAERARNEKRSDHKVRRTES